MTVVNGYCSVVDVRSQLGDTGDKLDEALIERAISATSRAVERHCGRRFWQDPAPVTRLYSADCSDRLDVDDIATKDGVLVEVDRGGAGDWVALDAADYHLEPLNADADGGAYAWWTIVVDTGPGFPVSSRPLVRATARWGWSQIPDQVGEASLIKSVSLFRRKDAPFGVAGFGDFGVVRLSRFDPDVLELLRPLRKPVIA
ncbi:phage head-tail connector protein [Actinoallomurus spadix]|uniref:Phage gp6-like head-tail connector protein n=1 Tax=Actinoallomurus spadix TaxID=79912 RepID=A0ABN0WVI8_9ACTN|nr:phage head-tail connector protein [Actinoallomurus spadix]MCO5986569.1 phage head-tail connector protein [Actinoallomurus spadix]